MSHEAEFAYRVRTVLDQSCEQLDERIVAHLRVARAHALDAMPSKQRVLIPALASPQGALLEPASRVWSARLVLILSLLMLVVGLRFAGEVFDEQDDSDLADLESALLADDLPPSAYLDDGFLAFMKTKHTW